MTHVLSTGEMLSGGGLRVLVPRELAYDNRDGQWRWRDDIPPRNRRLAMTTAEIDDLLDRGFPLPEWHTPPAVAKELARARPPRRHRGLVVFFTGFSGSGKSTIARGLADSLRESGERTITLLDGDVVRRELSAGLGFSKADRDRNVRRIGWVAAEVGRHHGMAIACPIAPYESARAAARAMALEAGAGFLLVHVNTPLEVCEQRDRKGLYARARAGQLRGHDRHRRPVRGADRRRADARHHHDDGPRGGRRGADLPGRERLGGAQTGLGVQSRFSAAVVSYVPAPGPFTPRGAKRPKAANSLHPSKGPPNRWKRLARAADLSHYLGMFRRHWWVVLIATGAGLGLGAAVTSAMPKVYESSTSVLVQPVEQDTNAVGGRTKGAINLDTEAQLVGSGAVAAKARRAAALRRCRRSSWPATSSVEVPANTTVLVDHVRRPARPQARPGRLARVRRGVPAQPRGDRPRRAGPADQDAEPEGQAARPPR